MSVYNDDLVTNMLIGKDDLTPYLTKVYAMGKNVGNLQRTGVFNAEDAGIVRQEFVKNTGAVRAFNAGLDESKKRFDMNVLSWMFGGMALQRLSLTLTRFFIPSMANLEKINDVAAKKTMAVGAAFEFLRVSLFETLANTKGFEIFVQMITKASIWIAEFTQKHPLIVEMAAAIAGIGVVLGTLAMGVGIFGQLEHIGVLMGFGAGGELTGAGMAGASSSILESLKMIGAIVAIAKIGLDVAEFVSGEATFKKTMEDIGASLALLGAVSGMPWVVAIGLTLKFMEPLDKMGEKLQNWGAEKMKAMWENAGDPNRTMGSTASATVGGMAGFLGFLGGSAARAPNQIVDLLSGKTAISFDVFKQKNEESSTAVTKLFDSISGDQKTYGLIPSMDKLDQSVKMNTQSLPLMTKEINTAKTAIDKIPNETHKYVYIHTVQVSGSSSSASKDKKQQSSITGG